VILESSAIAVGLMAALIAVGGFLGRALTTLPRGSHETVERATAVGGLAGTACAVLVIVVDAVSA
jgi:hypothetical protein